MRLLLAALLALGFLCHGSHAAASDSPGIMKDLANFFKNEPRSPADGEIERLRDAMKETVRATLAFQDATKKADQAYRLKDWKIAYDEDNRAVIEEGKMKDAFKTVIAETRPYNIGPKKTSGPLRQGPLSGRQAQWAPELLIGRVYVKTEAKDAADHKDHYFKAAEGEGRGGRTIGTGQVMISFDLPRRAYGVDEPAILAIILQHEGRHFSDLLSRWPSKTFQKGEVDAYDESVTLVDKLLPAKLQDTWRGTFQSQRDTFQAQIDAKKTRMPFPTPAEEIEFKKGFDAQEKARAETRRSAAPKPCARGRSDRCRTPSTVSSLNGDRGGQ